MSETLEENKINLVVNSPEQNERILELEVHCRQLEKCIKDINIGIMKMMLPMLLGGKDTSEAGMKMAREGIDSIMDACKKSVDYLDSKKELSKSLGASQ